MDDEIGSKLGIFTGKNTYLGAIRAAQPIFKKNWGALSEEDGRILLGLSDKDGYDYGLLGHMRRAHTAVDVFLKPSHRNLKTREEIKLAIDELLPRAPIDDLPSRALRAHEIITNRDGFDFGVATRLMALARPEALVSVNSESVQGLAQLSGYPASGIKTSRGYERLIQWVINGKWWNVPQPTDPRDRDLWSFRGALIDALVFEGPK